LAPYRVIDGFERRVMGVEHVLEDLRQVLQQVKPISDLGGLWRPLAGPVGIGSGPIARDDHHPRVASKPLRKGLGLAFGKQGHWLPALQVNQHRAIGVTFAEREITHA
jgi:hypothetical protein